MNTTETLDVSDVRAMRAREIRRAGGQAATWLGGRVMAGLTWLGESLRPLFSWNPDRT